MSRERIAALDVSGVLAVAVIYLEVEGVPAHLRTLLRRLHDRLPGVPVVVGLWQPAAGATSGPTPTMSPRRCARRSSPAATSPMPAGAADRELLAAFG